MGSVWIAAREFSETLTVGGNLESEAKLLPCPFCGSDDLEICNTHTPSYWVECHKCGAEAHGESFKYTTKQHNDFHSKPLPPPYVKAMKSAIAAWNRRMR